MKKKKSKVEKLVKTLERKLKSKELLKKGKVTVDITPPKQEEYTPIYFKMEVEDAKRKLFFK